MALTSADSLSLSIDPDRWRDVASCRDTDPDLFFLGRGDPDTMNANISRMIDSVSAFMDLDRMRNVCMSEYLLRTPGATGVRRP